MTPEQYKLLADKLLGTRHNVYRLAKSEYGVEWTDDDFDKLEEHGKVFRCEGCDEWMLTREMDDDVKGFCEECVNNMDGKEDQE